MFKFIKRVFFIFILLAFLTVGLGIYYLAGINRLSSLSEIQSVTIDSGMGASEIAELLYTGGFIRSKILFEVYLQLNDLRATLQAGEYEIPPGLNLKETVDILQHGTFDLKLTFPEGWRREQMAEYAAEISNPPASSSLPTSQDPSDSKTGEAGFESLISKKFKEDFLSASEGMEGYLFPETYIVPRDTTGGELVTAMRKMFDEKFTAELSENARQRGLSENDVVILASIVEREVKFDEDRAQVAGLLVKRWQNDWPLESDATTQYAVANNYQLSAVSGQPEWWPKRLTDADLAIDSPYNTRKYRGLPPGPICSPGLEALEAVVNYEESPYWFYVSDKAGKIYFSVTLDEHNGKVLKYASD